MRCPRKKFLDKEEDKEAHSAPLDSGDGRDWIFKRKVKKEGFAHVKLKCLLRDLFYWVSLRGMVTFVQRILNGKRNYSSQKFFVNSRAVK